MPYNHCYAKEPIVTQSTNVIRPPNLRWTAESLAQLSAQELRQLRENAERVGAADVVRLCDEELAGRPKGAEAKGAQATKRKHHLVARRTAFQMRGVQLHTGVPGWSGVREADGTVVFSLWADDIRRGEGGCRYLLWAPNQAGSRPWSDTASGKERLQHCKLAKERGRAEGLLVYGERHANHLPEERATTVAGVDPDVVIALEVVQHGDSYWAVWGRRATSAF